MALAKTSMLTYIMVIILEDRMKIAVAEAKAQFAELIRRAEAGEAIELTRYGRPVARIVGAGRAHGKPLIGAMAGAFTLPDDMFEGDAEIAAMFDPGAGD